MAKTTFSKLTSTILILLTFLALHLPRALPADTEEEAAASYNASLSDHFISRSRFLGSKVQKGARCDPDNNNICNGVSAGKGSQLLQCCKKKGVNILGDMNHCGKCGHKCKQGQRCCGGVCTNVMSNVNHCGKCNKKCKPGIPCQFGFCGYA
ncbi:protein GRIM REAPER-like [Prosopis cineraria]|uniref:protein GRIM REAPER-like n=1 Tax=Prosopis cineraria TaxID=364024 RepID=UPI00240FA293|nr:protein GRIM REAPER-like [Prosopis cineraria]